VLTAEQDRGTYRKYRDINFQDKTLELIDKANDIILEYDRQNLDMTLRQLYYQMVARGFIANNDKEYDKLQSAVNDGRMAGIISWTAIEDRTRSLMGINTMDTPEQAVKSLAHRYKRDLHLGQQFRPEVWVEKEAQIGNVAGICNELRVDYFACRGYNSQSNQWRAGRRFADYIRRGQTPIVFHLGDHDPSGVHMTQDNRERLTLFAGTPIIVQRLALNMDQVMKIKPPPNPAKLKTDSRGRAYVEYMEEIGHGDKAHISWELDALTPTFIRDLIREAVMKVRDQKAWDEQKAREDEDIRRLEDFADDLLGDGDDD